jgi:hypothetical protein
MIVYDITVELMNILAYNSHPACQMYIVTSLKYAGWIDTPSKYACRNWASH